LRGFIRKRGYWRELGRISSISLASLSSILKRLVACLLLLALALKRAMKVFSSAARASRRAFSFSLASTAPELACTKKS
jgi:hypothetical protein